MWNLFSKLKSAPLEREQRENTRARLNREETLCESLDQDIRALKTRKEHCEKEEAVFKKNGVELERGVAEKGNTLGQIKAEIENVRMAVEKEERMIVDLRRGKELAIQSIKAHLILLESQALSGDM